MARDKALLRRVGGDGMKRSIELVAALAGLVVLLPVALVIAAAIRIETRGPAVFSQMRVGRRERPFRCHKFRSMRADTPERPTHDMVRADVTRVGRFIRNTKLDELPQLWNVVVGEMSLVGPRPCLPQQTELIEARRRRGVYELRPGITGLAQVEGIDMSRPQRLARVDALYRTRASLKLDAQLLWRTFVRRRRVTKSG